MDPRNGRDIRRLNRSRNERTQMAERVHVACGQPAENAAVPGNAAQGDFALSITPPSALVSSVATSLTSFPRMGKRSFGTREVLPETEIAAKGSLQSS